MSFSKRLGARCVSVGHKGVDVPIQPHAGFHGRLTTISPTFCR
jgi:hypothetical protein